MVGLILVLLTHPGSFLLIEAILRRQTRIAIRYCLVLPILLREYFLKKEPFFRHHYADTMIYNVGISKCILM